MDERVFDFIENPEHLACQCGCGLLVINRGIMPMLEDFADCINAIFGDQYKLKLNVHSFNCCQVHNVKSRGYDKIIDGVHKVSFHVPVYKDAISGETIKRKINACDFHIQGLDISELHRIAIEYHGTILTGGLLLYSWGIHVDTAGFRFRDMRG